MIRCSSGIGVMLGDAQIGLVGMVVQTVKDVGGLAHRCRDDPCIERPIAARHMGVEYGAGIDAVFRIDGAAGFGPCQRSRKRIHFRSWKLTRQMRVNW